MNGQTTNHYWDGSDIVRETVANNAIYYRGINIIAQNSGNNISYYLRDAHGDTIGLAKSTGGVKDYKHDAFGNLAYEYGTSVETPFRYNGQYTDDETGLLYLRNRYYDPSIGRFTQEDQYWNVNNMIYGDKQYEEGETKIPDYSAIAQSGNLYAYCMNDPVNGVDPWGTVARDHFSTPDEAAVDWAWNYYGITQYSMIEHASLIYYAYDEYGNKYYSYTECVDGTPNDVQTNLLDTHIQEGQYCVGAIHSHTVTNKLSNGDLQLAEDQGYAVVYVVGESMYSDGVDICKIHDYYDGNGYQYQAVASDRSYRRLSIPEQRQADDYFSKKWNWYYDEIQYNYYLKATRGY